MIALTLLFALQYCTSFVAVAISWQELQATTMGSSSAVTVIHSVNELSTGDIVVGGYSSRPMMAKLPLGENLEQIHCSFTKLAHITSNTHSCWNRKA